jgi:hypothetical protein
MDFKKHIVDQINDVASQLDKKKIRTALHDLKISGVTYSKYLDGNGQKIDIYQQIFDALKQQSNGVL